MERDKIRHIQPKPAPFESRIIEYWTIPFISIPIATNCWDNCRVG